MLKRGLALLATSVFFLVMISAAAEQEVSGPESDGFRYRVLEDGTAEILQYAGKSLSLVIPDTLEGYPVTSIGDEAFYHYRYSMKELEIPDTVTHIGSLAFAMTDLNAVEIPKGVVSMGDNPFGYCDKLESISVAAENPVFYVQDGVLFCREDKSLVCFPALLANGEYTVPEGTEIIRGRAFGGVECLKRIHLPDSLRGIGVQAFGFCWDLEEMEIPDHVTEIGNAAFDSCKSLERVTLPAGLTRIGSMMFYECGSLKTADIPETVTEIGDSAFDYCASLEKVRIPDGVTVIRAGAFEGCEQIESAVIPEGVTLIDGFAFGGCFRLSKVQIPDTVTKIGESAFQYCGTLTELVIPDSVTFIGENAFFNCSPVLVIVGSPDSYAKTYCEANGIAFRAE